MDITKNVKHNFNLMEMNPGDEFLGCDCGFHLNPGQAMNPICPDCGKKLSIFKVSTEDIANQFVDTCCRLLGV